mmetsp:Transcript_14330/g.21462  ORF Transcript_14330/g.21462 Transcript_14330/m.21462 type:complete len:401 (-) Transcript_14330:46-1248(-)|eukprot:CAMPEP_0185031428 /NCGR_PEP_ID=MMETSP1103-20130426/18896_1 /TAXON_ID=36769 /ORGANISM="Paraphysomonas bandaiensis, Strain Caron Lab Isolate" /LENGTH=400 /DNA_ID=CAMNT_0027566953 /DNA_START=95 /DNA_END=1297 /DNA_ORIENTATION=-
MGAGPSTAGSNEYFAFNVVKREYELLKTSLSDSELHTHLEKLFVSAKAECSVTSYLECREPSCILEKIETMSPDDMSNCRDRILEALNAREKAKGAPKGEADYSKGFSGTAADTKAEKEFEKMMRESGGECPEESDEYTLYPALRPPNILYREQEAALRSAGSWCRFLAASGCYMYCHSLTRAVVSLRPEDYQDEEDKDVTDKAENEADKDPANGLPSCHITELPTFLERLRTEGNKKTPLLLDGTDGSQTLTYYSMKAMLEDVSGLVVPYATSGVKRSDVMERCRSRLVGALKSGSTFVLYLGSITVEHADFKKKLCKKDVFPSELFQESGAKLFAPKSNPRFKLLYRESDMDEGTGDPAAKEEFKFMCVSTLNPYEYQEKLEDSLPLGYMYPVYVHNL